MPNTEPAPPTDLDAHVAEIVSSYLASNQVAAADLPKLITAVHHSLRSLGKAHEPEPVRIAAVSIRQSVHRDYVTCLDCAWRGKTLRSHIRRMHELAPDAYRARWSLKPDHPLTAPAYSEKRAEFAKQIGLGNRRIGAGEPVPASD
jgi:predicted transcriptional regulator